MSNFDFAGALLNALGNEGLYDKLDYAPTSADPPQSLSPATSPFSSPLSSLPSSTSSSPHSSPPSSPILLPLCSLDDLLPELSPISKTKKRKAERSKQSSKNNRNKKRNLEGPKSAEDIPARSSTHAKHVEGTHALRADFSMKDDAAVASTSYVGLRDEGIDYAEGAYWLDEVVGPNSKFNFDLVSCEAGTSLPFVDEEDRLFAVLVRPTDDPSWRKCVSAAGNLIEKLRSKCHFTEKQTTHRRGDFPALSCGISYGGGQTCPGNLIHNAHNSHVLKKLTDHWSFQRLSGFATGIFKAWAPRLYEYYSTHLSRLLNNDDTLVRLFKNSVCAAAAFNFGPRTVTYPHIDFANLPFGLCFIWSLGRFNPKKGGHIILWDLKKVVEFPPGSVVVIPSGVCRHSNTRVWKTETRYSFTQYSAGGLFRWVDHGFQTEEDYQKRQTKQEAKDEKVRKRNRWQMGLGLLSTLQELGLKT